MVLEFARRREPGEAFFTGEFPEVLGVMQTELGSFDFAQDDRIKGAKRCSLGMTG
jgi:hypothetical protein